MKRSDLNHLRRLVAWVQCEIGQSTDELVTTMRNLAERGITPEITGCAAVRLMDGLEQHHTGSRNGQAN